MVLLGLQIDGGEVEVLKHFASYPTEQDLKEFLVIYDEEWETELDNSELSKALHDNKVALSGSEVYYLITVPTIEYAVFVQDTEEKYLFAQYPTKPEFSELVKDLAATLDDSGESAEALANGLLTKGEFYSFITGSDYTLKEVLV